MSVVNIGLGGFNTLERCGIVRWGRASFPAIQVHVMQRPEDCLLMTGLVLDADCYMQWHRNLPVSQPVLFLSEVPVMTAHSANVTVLLISSEIRPLEAAISAWLMDLSCSSTRVRVPREHAAFSAREIAVLRLLKEGATNEEIAATLGIKLTTVKTYLRRIYERLGALNRAHAVSRYKELERV